MTSPAAERAAGLGGAVLAAATRATAAVTPAGKPLHPRGVTRRGRLHRHGLARPVGVPWLDRPGVDDVVVRQSRAVGLPAAWPDVHGLAVKVPLQDGREGDLLLASTGWGRLTRFLLTASRDPWARPMTTLLPYRTPAGPLLLGARAERPDVIRLACAAGARLPDGAWRPVADLVVTDEEVPGGDRLSFDPVRHRLPGLDQFGWVARLREPSYAHARRSRGAEA